MTTSESDLQDLPSAADLGRPADRAYHTIRAAILSRELPPGAHLAESTLAEMCGASRTPVREALQRLSAEGLALSEGRSRFVADFNYDEVSVVFELRARIEGYAASLAARHITDAELERLADLVRQMDEVPATEPESFVPLNDQFHKLILNATRSTQLRSVTAQVFALPLATIKQFLCDQPLDPVRSNSHHKDILRALRSRDPEWASAAMLGHILSSRPLRSEIQKDRAP